MGLRARALGPGKETRKDPLPRIQLQQKKILLPEGSHQFPQNFCHYFPQNFCHQFLQNVCHQFPQSFCQFLQNFCQIPVQ